MIPLISYYRSYFPIELIAIKTQRIRVMTYCFNIFRWSYAEMNEKKDG